MSSKPKKTADKPVKEHSEAPARPAGKAPVAMVESRHETGMVTRPGRGFSLGELSGAGVNPRLAASWGIRVDYRRRSVLDGNVKSLKGRGVPQPAKRAPPAAKRAEEEAVKVEHVAKKEPVKVKEQAEAKKETAKVKKAAKPARAKRKKTE